MEPIPRFENDSAVHHALHGNPDCAPDTPTLPYAIDSARLVLDDRIMKTTRRQFVTTLTSMAIVGCSGSPTGLDGSDGGDAAARTDHPDDGRDNDAGTADAAMTDAIDADTGIPGVGEGSPFGIASSASSSRDLGWLPAIAATGIGWLRGFDSGSADARLTQAAASGVRVAGILEMGSSFPSDDLAGWTTYIRGLLADAAGRVRYWEVWNEPPNFTTNGDPAAYAAIVRSAYDTVKSIDPTLQVGLCAKSVHVNFLAHAIDAGAADHFDYITLHPYEVLGVAVQQGFEPQFLAIVATVRAMLRDRNPSRAEVPIWFTELGEPVDDSHTAAHQAGTLIKAYTMSIAQGITRIHWFEGRDGDSGPFGLIAGNGTMRPSYTAMRALIDAVGTMPRYAGWLLLDDAHFGFVFETSAGPVLVAWARHGATAMFDLGASAQLIDPLTGASTMGRIVSLSSSPSIARGIPSALVTQARANRTLATPWGSDPGHASSVSLDATREAGLHPLQTLSTVMVDGERVLDLSHGASTAFAVDPAFLSYATVPIRITIEVRANGGGNAGFNLKYESTGIGGGSRGWNGVPGSDRWYTLSWDLTDTRFVAMWGYNFSLDSDSTTNSHYNVRNITVTKL